MREELEKILSWYKEEYPKKVKYFREIGIEPAEEKAKAFEWSDVGIHPSKIFKLVEKGFLRIVYKSRKRTEYVADLEKIRGFLSTESLTKLKPERRRLSFDDLFKRIVGYEDVKEALKMILKTDLPVGFIAYGPPATAKSLFLEDLYHYYGERAEFMTGNEFSSTGLAKLIREREPEAIIIDEIDKAKPQELSALLQPMEGGYVRRVKGDSITEAKIVEIKVFMAGNSIKRVPEEIISRCKPFVLYLPEYDYEQFKQICLNYLPEESGVSRETAEYIAEEVWKMDRDIRAARNLARVCGDDREKIKFMLDLVKKYRR